MANTMNNLYESNKKEAKDIFVGTIIVIVILAIVCYIFYLLMHAVGLASNIYCENFYC